MTTEMLLSITGVLIAAVTGIPAAITGILGLRASSRANQRVSQINSLDLRLKLKKALTEVHLDIMQLPLTIQWYCDSWKMFYASKHLGNQPISDAAREQAKWDGPEITRLRQALPENKGHENRSEKELEELIVKVHAIQLQVIAIKDKYSKKVHDLEEERKQYQYDLLQEMKRTKERQQAEQRARFSNPNSASDVLKFHEAGGNF